MKQLIVVYSFLIILISVKLSLESSIIPQKEKAVSFVHREANYDDKGFWKKHVEWKARFVKEWHEKKIWVPSWRKIWGPIEINEWVPLPKENGKYYQEKHVNLNLI